MRGRCLIAGAPPYTDRSATEMTLAHRDKPIRKLREAAAEVPLALEGVYIQMVAKRADHRFQSMGQVVAAMEKGQRDRSPCRTDRERRIMRLDSILR